MVGANGGIVTDTDLLVDRYRKDRERYEKALENQYIPLTAGELKIAEEIGEGPLHGVWIAYIAIGILSGGLGFILLAPVMGLIYLFKGIAHLCSRGLPDPSPLPLAH